jgi:hypothetical protein
MSPRRNPALPLVGALDALASARLRGWLRQHRNADAVAHVARAAAERAGACAERVRETVYDAEGRRYPVVYRFVPAYPDGRTVVTSHAPRDLEWVRGYPPEFQTRDLGGPDESVKIENIARNLDPLRLLGRNLDPTLGPPVTWQGADGRLYVLGGNGRTIAFLRAPDEAYQRYLDVGRCLWADFPAQAAPGNSRWLLVRVVLGISQEQAAQLAAASQLSTSAEEGRIGKALGLIRSLNLHAGDLPPVTWTAPIAADNVSLFAKENVGFVEEVLSRMDPAKRARYRGDSDALANLVTAVFLGFLPAEIRRAGLFENPKVEDALLGAMPGILTTHALARSEGIYPGFDLYPVLPPAVAVFQSLQRMRLSFEKLRQALEAERRTARIPGAPRLSDAPDIAIALAAALYNASRRAAPEVVVSQIIAGYVEEASKYNPRQAGLFGGGGHPDPAAVLAAQVPGFRLPSEPEPEPEAPPARGMFGNPPRHGRHP